MPETVRHIRVKIELITWEGGKYARTEGWQTFEKEIISTKLTTVTKIMMNTITKIRYVMDGLANQEE